VPGAIPAAFPGARYGCAPKCPVHITKERDHGQDSGQEGKGINHEGCHEGESTSPQACKEDKGNRKQGDHEGEGSGQEAGEEGFGQEAGEEAGGAEEHGDPQEDPGQPHGGTV
jgi:hypothetical protein